jgi:hypothetical protein
LTIVARVATLVAAALNVERCESEPPAEPGFEEEEAAAAAAAAAEALDGIGMVARALFCAAGLAAPSAAVGGRVLAAEADASAIMPFSSSRCFAEMKRHRKGCRLK